MSVFGSHPWLSASVVPLAWCWRIERRDGVTLGLTTHDVPLVIDGLIYRPEPGIRPSAIRQKQGLGDDSVDIDGAITSGTLTAGDLAAGRWNGARVSLIVADWEAADRRYFIVAQGRLGGVSHDGVSFTAELSGRDPRLSAMVAPDTSAECRADLGDRQCRVALVAHRHHATAQAISGRRITLDHAVAGDTLAFGRLRWTTGMARGLTSVIVAHDGVRVTVARAASGAVTGDAVELIEGCDKRAATCATRFANIANFRGEPHLPGIDLLTRFPGA